MTITGAEIIKFVAFASATICMGLGAIGPAVGSGMAGAKGCEAIGKRKETQFSVMKTMLIAMAIAGGNGVFSLVIALMLIYVVS